MSKKYEVRAEGPWGESLEGSHATLDAAISHAHRIAGKSAPRATVWHGRDLVYKATGK